LFALNDAGAASKELEELGCKFIVISNAKRLSVLMAML